MGRPSSQNIDSATSLKKKQKAAGILADEATGVSSPLKPTSAGFLSKSTLNSTINDELWALELEIKKRMEFQLLKAESKVDELKSGVNFALLYLPRDVQSMKVKDFSQKFGGNLSTFEDYEKKRAIHLQTSKLQDISTKKQTARKIISAFGSNKKSAATASFASQTLNESNTVLFQPNTPSFTDAQDFSLVHASFPSTRTPGSPSVSQKQIRGNPVQTKPS